MSPLLLDDIKIIGIYLCLGILIYLVIRSKRWTEPARAIRLEAVEDNIKVLRGNFHRLERDVDDWRKDMMLANEQILERLDAIQRNGAHEHPLAEKVEQIADRVEDLEQAIHGLPCGQRLPEVCPTKEK